MPSRAKMMRKRKRRSSREAMDFIEFSRDATRLDRAVQWLSRCRVTCSSTQTEPQQLIRMKTHFYKLFDSLYLFVCSQMRP